MKIFIKKLIVVAKLSPLILRFLLKLDNRIYGWISQLSVLVEGGIHPKHRLTGYHEFFIKNVKEGDTVLDVGCGNGVVLKDVVMKTGAVAVGIDISTDNVMFARKRFKDLLNVEIFQCDVFEYTGNRKFDVILLSNVLEHLDKRIELLRYLITQFTPKQFLIRVPMLEREWLVPYKRELGIESRLDPTHETEYTEDEFRNELTNSGLHIDKIIFRWGEMWVVAVPR